MSGMRGAESPPAGYVRNFIRTLDESYDMLPELYCMRRFDWSTARCSVKWIYSHGLIAEKRGQQLTS